MLKLTTINVITNAMLVIRTGINKKLFRIGNREDPDQNANGK